MGLTVDTNSPYFMGKLFAAGEKVKWSQTVGDVHQDIIRAIRDVSARSDAVLVSGGLGPTADDLTAECAAAAAGVPLVESEVALESIKRRFAKIGLTFSANNSKQALVPEGAEVVLNPVGSAPMFIQRIGHCSLFYLPGVPREYRFLVDHEVMPRLQKMIERQPGRVFRASRLLKTVNLAESHLDQRVAPIARDNPLVNFGFRTHAPENHLKLLAEAPSQEEANRALARAEQQSRLTLASFVFGADDESFPAAVAKLLLARKETVAIAESCTGGIASGLLTSVPGASEFFVGGAVVYSEAMKQKWAGLDGSVLKREGAVSKAAAEAMALGIREVAGTSYGLAITGYAGPGGGTTEDPIGTVYVGLAGPTGVVSERRNFGGERERIRQFAAYYALNMLRLQLHEPR